MLNSCASGDGIAFFSPSRTMQSGTQASLDLASPGDDAGRSIAVAGLRLWASVRLSGTGDALRARVEAITDSGVEPLVELGDGLNALEHPIAIEVPGRTWLLRLALACSPADDHSFRAVASAAMDCYPNQAVAVHVRGLEVTLREDVPPAGLSDGGTLLSEGPTSSIRSLQYSASDRESGLQRVEVLIGGTVVAAKDLSGQCSYADFTACPVADRDTFSIDTRKVPDGRHAVTLRTFDAAGNRRDEQLKSIEVQNGSQVAASGFGAGSAQLTAGFAGSSRSTLVVPFGRRVTVRGRLSTTSRAGVANARIEVFERTVGSEAPVGSVRTRSDGTFSYRLAGTRPTRTIRLVYGPTSSRRLKVKVRAASSLKTSLRGTRLRFSGRVLARPIPRNGKRVRLHGRAPGTAWSSFATLRTDRRGRFSGSYRLSVRRPGVKLQIRVVVPAERGYPYLGYKGRPITVRVR